MGIAVVDLTRTQHLDIIRALAEQSGGRFRYLNNTIPAYRRAEGEWIKLEHGRVPDAFAAEKHLRFRIVDLPLHEDRLGGIAKIKDTARLTRHVESLLDTPEIRALDPSTISQLIQKELLDDGAVIPMGDFESQLRGILKRSKASSSVLRALELSDQVIAWPEHNLRLQSKPLPADKLVGINNNTVSYYQSPEYLTTILAAAAEHHYMRPELFLIEVHAGLHNNNLALTFEGMAGNVSEIPHDVGHYLKDALVLYRENGRAAFEDAAKMLRMEYRPLHANTRTISVEQGLKMLREAFNRTCPSSTTSMLGVARNEHDGASLIVRHLAIRKYLWSYRGVLNRVLAQDPQLPIDKINERWDKYMQACPVSLSTPLESLTSLAAQLDKTYGDMILRTTAKMQQELDHRLSMHLGGMELAPALEHFHEIVKRSVSAGGQPVEQFRRQVLLDEFLSPGYLQQQANTYKNNRSLPSIENFVGAVEDKQHNVLVYDELPPSFKRV